jgi:thioredoxin-related protein
MRITRRGLLGATLAGAGAATAETILTEDGLHRQSWFLDSFLDLGPDLEDAAAAGKRFAVMWELRGCPACRDTHLINFARPEVSEYIRARFDILQLNLIGDLPVTDFDGSSLGERRLAERYGVRFTPTIQFFPEAAEGLGGLRPRNREVLRLVGYQEPDAFRRSFAYVAERIYETGESLAEWLSRPA